MGNIDYYPIVQGNISIEIAVSCADHDDIARAITSGNYEFPTHFFMLSALLPNGGRVLDLGAHLGTFSLFAAAMGYDVLAVEPSPDNVALLQASVDRNGFKNLQIAHCAVSDRPGSCEFIPAGPYGIVANPNIEGRTVVVEAKTVPQLAEAQRWPTIDFVKMDVEGSEMAALRGMKDEMAPLGMPILAYESNVHTLRLFGHTPGDVLRLLESSGYHSYYVIGRRLAPTTSDGIQPIINLDCLALREPLSENAVPDWTLAPLSVVDNVWLMGQGIFSSHPHPREYARSVLKQYGQRLLPRSTDK